MVIGKTCFHTKVHNLQALLSFIGPAICLHWQELTVVKRLLLILNFCTYWWTNDPFPIPTKNFLYVPLSDDVVPLLKIQSYLICVELISNICFFFIDRFWYKLGNFLILYPKILPNRAIVIDESYFIGFDQNFGNFFQMRIRLFTWNQF